MHTFKFVDLEFLPIVYKSFPVFNNVSITGMPVITYISLNENLKPSFFEFFKVKVFKGQNKNKVVS